MKMPSRSVAVAVCAALAIAFAPPPMAAQTAPPPLKIGLIMSFTGGVPWAPKQSAATIAALLKLHGEVAGGRKVQIIQRDDTGIAPEVARRQAQELIVQDHVDILVGTNLTPNAIAVAQVSTQAKVPFFIVNSATSNVMKDQPYSARFGFDTQTIVPPLAAYAAKNYGKTAYSIYQNYGPGIDAGKSFETSFTAAGGTMIGTDPIPITNKDFSAYIQRVRDAKPAILFVFLNAQGGGAELLKDIEQAGIIKSGIHVVATGDIVDEYINPTIVVPPLGLVTTFNYSRMHDSALNRQFVAAYHAAQGDNGGPDFTAVQEYDALHAVYLVADALHGDLSDPDKVMSVVKTLKFESPRGPFAIDPATRDSVQNVYLRKLTMVKGQLENVEFETVPMVKDPTENY
ncbi:MAG: ABC transporter substrate-binding protein [Candidatus Lustribacter sp.]|jgi:branched-chain amino acid transport system substrate-binding protein